MKQSIVELGENLIFNRDVIFLSLSLEIVLYFCVNLTFLQKRFSFVCTTNFSCIEINFHQRFNVNIASSRVLNLDFWSNIDAFVVSLFLWIFIPLHHQIQVF